MDDDFRRLEREAERQGRQAYMNGKERNPKWPIDFLAAFDRAAEEDRLDLVAAQNKPRRTGRDESAWPPEWREALKTVREAVLKEKTDD